jgi:hypothetical protein
MPDEIPRDDAVDVIMSGYRDALRDKGLDEKALARGRKAQFQAHRTRTVKIKGKLEKDFKLPPGYKVVAKTTDTDGETELIIQVKEIAWGVRQRATESIEKLLGIITKANDQEFSGVIVIHSDIPEVAPLPEEFKDDSGGKP